MACGSSKSSCLIAEVAEDWDANPDQEAGLEMIAGGRDGFERHGVVVVEGVRWARESFPNRYTRLCRGPG